MAQPSTRIQDWVRWYKNSPEGYHPHALTAVLRSDGPQALAQVLKALKLEQSTALIQSWADVPRATPGARSADESLPSNKSNNNASSLRQDDSS